jgi:small-conductance mechanosensitive channel/CRP-like cAMP-binding protein
MLTVGLTFFFVALALRAVSGNRFVRTRLAISCGVFGLYAGAAATLTIGHVPVVLADQLRTVAPLLLAFGVANALVVLVVNPWREDRIPERFPHIVQDALVIVLFASAAALLLPDKLAATTAVGAVVIGFALQDTLGNLFAGLAIQIEKPFHVGQWVTIGGHDGLVSEITWRATKIRTKSGNFVVVPNNVLSRDTITNYSEPTRNTAVEVDVGASYDTPPNDVKAAIRSALAGEPLITHDREPDILVSDFAASAITYRIRVWANDFGTDEFVRDRVRTLVYYAFRRHGITIPYPIQVQIERSGAVDAIAASVSLAGVEIFSGLSDAQRGELEDAARPLTYAAGETIVREGDAGGSMFVLERGDAAVTLAHTGGELARLRAGGFFGEMSLLTGEPRTATVTAVTDCVLLEIGTTAFRRVVMADATILERVSAAVAKRRAEQARHRETNAAAEPPEPAATFLDRVRRFLSV